MVRYRGTISTHPLFSRAMWRDREPRTPRGAGGSATRGRVGPARGPGAVRAAVKTETCRSGHSSDNCTEVTSDTNLRGRRVCGKPMYYFCEFLASLKLFQNLKNTDLHLNFLHRVLFLSLHIFKCCLNKPLRPESVFGIVRGHGWTWLGHC